MINSMPFIIIVENHVSIFVAQQTSLACIIRARIQKVRQIIRLILLKWRCKSVVVRDNRDYFTA